MGKRKGREREYPIDGNVGLVVVELDGTTDGATSRDLAELEEPVEHGAILTDVDWRRGEEGGGEGEEEEEEEGRTANELLGEGLHVVGRDSLEEVDVVVRVEARHLRGNRLHGALRGKDKNGEGVVGRLTWGTGAGQPIPYPLFQNSKQIGG